MNPLKYAQMMKYLTRAKKADPDLPDVFPASKAPIPPKTQTVEEMEAINRFMRANPRTEKAGGGRIGFAEGPKKILTGEKFIKIAEKFPDATNQQLLEYFNKNNFVNRTGDPLSIGAIKTQKSKFFDIAAETKAKIPKGYIKSTNVFKNLPISKEDYFRVKQAKEGGTLLTQEIDKFLKPVKIGEVFYFKKPNKTDLKSFVRLADKTGRLNNRIADLMIDFDKVYGKNFAKGIIPDIEDVKQKFNITDSTAGKVTTRLAQWYGGQDFKNPQLKDLKRNKVVSNKMFKTIEKSQFGNPYRDGLYKISLETIDAKLGNKQGTFEKFKTQAKQILKNNNIPIYDPKMGKNAFGFNINEIAGVTGSAKSKAAEFSQFVDIMDGNINTKAMAGFQSKFSTVRQIIENDPTKLSVESKKINKIAQDLEKRYGVELPRLRDPDATKYFSPTRLRELNAQGLDIVKAAERAGYTVQMPKGAVTVQEFIGNKKTQANLLKKMGFKCKFAGSNGGAAKCDDPASYADDINKTRSELNSSDVAVRAAANAKLNKGLQVAKTLPTIGKFLRRVGQATVGGVSKALQATGLGTPVGLAIEGMVEGGIYDYYRGKGYTHDQAYSETFFPGIITGRKEGVPWYGGAESLLEKELVGATGVDEEGKTIATPENISGKVAQYVSALKDQDQVYDAFGRLEQGQQASRKDIIDAAQADIRDFSKTGTIDNINKLINVDTRFDANTAKQAYEEAVEAQAAKQAARGKAYKDEYYVNQDTTQDFDNKLQKKRNEDMLQMFPTPTVDDVQDVYKAAGRGDDLKYFEAQDYKDFMKQMDDYQKQSYFADNFRLEKAGGGIAKLAGDSSGRPPVSGPNPQGLLSLKNRVRNY